MKIRYFVVCGMLLVAMLVGQATGATESPQVLNEEAQIQVLLAQIAKLKALIVDTRLKKEIVDGSYLVVDVSDGSIIAQKNAGQTYPIASLTKLMNAVIALEHTNPDQTIILKEEMLKPLGYSPSLFLNLTVSVKNLLKASLIQSTNDAAEALKYATGQENFVKNMNQKAQELGMRDTYFYDAHGLSLLNRSTASDLAKLLAYIHQDHPDILAITKDNDFWLPDPTGKLLKFKNLNNFYGLAEFIGGKTGYLPQARQSLASIFNINGKPIAITLLYSKNYQADALKVMEMLR